MVSCVRVGLAITTEGTAQCDDTAMATLGQGLRCFANLGLER